MRKLISVTVALSALASAWASPPGWTYEGQWGGRGISPGKFRYPTGVAVAPSGRVYVADLFNFRIQYFTPTGSFLGTWGKYGFGDGDFRLSLIHI